MKRIFKYLVLAVLCLSAASCAGSITKKMQMAENVITTAEPNPLVVKGGKVPATITVTYPKGYFNANAVIVATPVMVFDNGGQQTGESITYQGEKIKDNFKTISSKGQTVTENISFDYCLGMEKSKLELRSVLIYNGQTYEMPTRTLAEGCITTGCDKSALKAHFDYKPDGYEKVLYQSTEGQIHYDVNSANVKKDQLKSQSIQDMQDELEEIKDNQRYKVTGTQIIAYASPEGGEEYNAKLSDRRAASAKEAWGGLQGGLESGTPEIKSIGQDWEGFQEAVAKSDMADKDLILRVLSMYSDPAVRESEIKNMSAIFGDLKKDVFPALRRARFITNTEFENYSDDELLKLAETRLYSMDEPSILHLANLATSLESKAALNKLAADKYNSQTGLYNLACNYLEAGDAQSAEYYLNKIQNQKDNDVINAQGVVKMLQGDYDAAAPLFEKCHNVANLGTIDMFKGDYEEAASKLDGTNSPNRAAAYIMNGEYDKAASALKGDDAQTWYYRAIVAARQGRSGEVKSALDKAFAKDASLKEKAQDDIEFAKYL